MAKINVSVSSSSSKPNVTVSKGPVGPQGEQGVQGESGPSGPAGVVPSLESIPNVHIPSLENGGYIDNPSDGGHIQNALTFDPQNNRWTTVNAAMGSVPTSGNKSAAPPTGNSWTDPILTVDFNESTSVASTKLALNNSNYIPSDVNLYVNGPSRFNGSVQIASGGSTVYTLPSADGTANQILKTDGSGAVSFTGDYLTKSTADVITATKRFNVQQDFVGGVNITNGASINGYTLPTSDGTAGQFLKTDGSGNISFAAASSLALGTTSTTALAGDTTTISTTQASEIAANTLKVGITTTQANAITANTAKTDTHLGNSNLTAALDIEYDQDGYDLVFDPKGGTFEINDSSGLPDAAEIAIGQGNVDIAGTQVSINGIDYPAVDGSAGQFLKTDGSGNLSFSNVAQSIDGLTDVDTTTTAPSDGQALVWDNVASQWEPGTIEGGVTSIVAGSGVGLSPTNGLGDVTISVNTSFDYARAIMGSDVLQGGASQQNFDSATAQKVKFNTSADTEGTGITIDTTNNRITVGVTGYYVITSNISFYSAGARTTPATRFKVNGSTDLLGQGYGYIRAANDQNDNNNLITCIVELQANDYVEVFVGDSSSISSAVYATQAFFEISSTGGAAGATGVQGPSGTTYDVVTLTGSTTLSSLHTTKYLVVNSSSNVNITVPASASYDTYAEFVIEQRGAGAVTVVAASGVTINTSETLVSGGQYSVMGLKRTASNVYTLTGERQAS